MKYLQLLVNRLKTPFIASMFWLYLILSVAIIINPSKISISSIKQTHLVICSDILILIAFAVFYVMFATEKIGKPIVCSLHEILIEDAFFKCENTTFAKMKVVKKTDEKVHDKNNHEYLLNLLNGTAVSADTSTLTHKSLEFCEQFFAFLLIKPNRFNLAQLYQSGFSKNDVNVIYINIFEELLNNSYEACINLIDGVYTCVINSASKDILPDLMTICEKAELIIEKHFHLKSYYALSITSTQPDEFFHFYEQALSELQYAEFMQLSKPIIHNALISQNVALISDKQKKDIISFLKNGDIECALSEFDSIITSASRLIPPSEFVSKIKIEMIIITALITDNVIFDYSGCIRQIVDFSNTLMNSNSINELRASLREYLTGLIVFTENSTVDAGQSSDLIEMILKFIEENYENPNLCAAMVCDRFNLHPAYLSRKFKNRCKIGMLQYINDYRIKKSAELLVNTKMSIDDIFIKVGYTNIRTFNRCFKSIHNMTPSAYRKQYKIEK